MRLKCRLKMTAICSCLNCVNPHINLQSQCTFVYFISILHSLPTWWRHQMEIFSALLAICTGNSLISLFSLIRAWMNDWVNSRGAGDLRRNGAHYDVTVMTWPSVHLSISTIGKSWIKYWVGLLARLAAFVCRPFSLFDHHLFHIHPTIN